MTGNRFVFVTPMFNASATLHQCISSLVAQSYKEWCLILIDDVSSQAEVLEEARIVSSWRPMCHHGGLQIKEVTWNDTKRWEVENVLRGVAMCEPDDIVCRLDADDWLIDNDCLAMLDAAYSSSRADCLWTAHRWGFSDRNISGPLPDGVDPYAHPWVSSHLKTFRKRLIDNVPYSNFTNMNGDLVRRAGDQAIYLPILHRASKRGFLPRVCYHYTIDERGGQVYQTDDARFQKSEADFLRARGYVPVGPSWESVMGL